MCVSFGDMLIVWCLYIIVVHFGERSHSMCIAGAQILQISILAKPRYDTRDKSNFLHCTSVSHICAVPIQSVIFCTWRVLMCCAIQLIKLQRSVLMHCICIVQYRTTRSLEALRAPTSSWRPFGPLDFVLRALRALRPCDPRHSDWIVC